MPRAWTAQWLGLAVLVGIGVSSDGVDSGDANYIKLALVVPLLMGWRVWTKKGMYSPLSFADLFVIDGRRVDAVHLAVWAVALLMVLLMLFRAIAELIG